MIITVPLQIIIPRKIKKNKVVHLSVNVWNNLHHATKTQVKNEIYKIVEPQLSGDSVMGVNITVACRLFPSHVNLDLGNFVTVAEKIVTDCVVRNGYIHNDTVKFINRHLYSYEGVDRENPRLEIEYIRG